MALVAAQVAEAFVDAVVLHGLHGLAQDADHALGHGGVEVHIGGEYAHLPVAHDVLHLIEGHTAAQPQGLSLGGQCHNTPIVIGEHAHGFAAEPGMKHALYGTEETVAIYQCIHYLCTE